MTPTVCVRGALSSRLKEETSQYHRQIERELNLLDPHLSLARYQNLLKRFHGFHASWDSLAGGIFNAALPGLFPPRRKLPALRHDLAYFGIPWSALPVCGKLPRLTTVADALGSLYVIEGATLGGQILFPTLQSRLGLDMDAGAAFFYGYGARTIAMWQSFKDVLAGYSNPDNDDRAVAHAIETFQALYLWFQGLPA